MKKEIKICLPWYKVLYAAAFIILMALVRGISSVNEIGISLDFYMPLLAIVFCADTCYQEVQEGRWEILSLMPHNSQRKMILQRMGIQVAFLTVLAGVGYGLFELFQQPLSVEGSISLFFLSLAAVGISILLFGTLSAALVNATGSLWGGIGSIALVWFLISSKMAQNLPDFLQIFAFSSRQINIQSDYSWMAGKITAILIAVLCLAFQKNIRKRKTMR